MQVELKGIQGEVGITFIYVTHDQDEALTMSDRIAVFNDGPDRAGRHARRRSTSTRRRRSSPASSAPRTSSSATGRASRSGPRRSGCSTSGDDRAGLQTEQRRDPRRRVRGHGDPLPRSRSMPAGSFRSSGRTSRRPRTEALEQRGREVTVGWRPEHAVAVTRAESEGRTRSERTNREVARCGSAWLIAGGLVAFLAVRGRLRRARRRARAAATPDMLQKVGKGEGELNLVAWAGYVDDPSG